MLKKKLYIYCLLSCAMLLNGCSGHAISYQNGLSTASYEASEISIGDNALTGEVLLSAQDIGAGKDPLYKPITPNDFNPATIGPAIVEAIGEASDMEQIQEPEEQAAEEEKEEVAVNPADVNAYEVGQIMIIMYHHIVDRPSKNNLERSVEDFWNDLQNLYDNGYRLVNISDLIKNEIKVEAGYSPVAITFDDGWSTAFSLAQSEEGLVPATNCAVDIINRFCEENPDFGMGACFYINAYTEPFKGAGTVEERFNYLIDAGYELGNHTYSHANLSTLGAEGIQREIMDLELYVKAIKPEYEMLSFCYPYGGRPSNANRNLALSGKYAENTYEYAWALREGPTNNSAAPNNVKFDPINVPRVRGTDNASYDLGWYINFYKENPGIIYISDGNPHTISLPEGKIKEVNQDSLGEKTLMLY